MKLRVLSDYHNAPAGLHLTAGVVEVDQRVAEFVKRDAPENFIDFVEQVEIVTADRPVKDDHTHDAIDSGGDVETDDEALAAPTKDKQVKRGKK